MAKVNDAVRKFLSEIGRKGGKKSRRTLTREQSLKMTEAREKKRRRQFRKKGG